MAVCYILCRHNETIVCKRMGFYRLIKVIGPCDKKQSNVRKRTVSRLLHKNNNTVLYCIVFYLFKKKKNFNTHIPEMHGSRGSLGDGPYSSGKIHFLIT